MKKANLTKIILSISVCVLIGFLSSFATRSSVDTWFLTLKKPFFNPPSWLFAPVWTILYILMGYSFAIIWSNPSKSRKSKDIIKNAMILFGIQLALNAIWSILFFGLCNPFLALIEILLLWLMIFETIKAFKKVDVYASKLLIPYLVWVSFATILNGSIWFFEFLSFQELNYTFTLFSLGKFWDYFEWKYLAFKLIRQFASLGA